MVLSHFLKFEQGSGKRLPARPKRGMEHDTHDEDSCSPSSQPAYSKPQQRVTSCKELYWEYKSQSPSVENDTLPPDPTSLSTTLWRVLIGCVVTSQIYRVLLNQFFFTLLS